ncbi:MAG: transcriptional repressor LexA [Actinomyces sp.]|jgi:repressor LexA|nr:transcriptional repressor LexA [Actinomyces sp.]MCI1641252.1 transcriptional repressor LexA [Actinomyces sp.]MCI1662071.1 transcriptional repressor LexA [Actinomyces sp.]MCI1691945.1 transcriptional repressor LexA [Actinomyces sp.]MCI1786873.1 transcriptional repressor LexA [Actinomyces sp.]MCI1828985.1 transcriptional repressor LexA [Actinomyces sp.]
MSDRPPLSARQQQILELVRASVGEHGYPPSVREIANAVGLASPSTVKHHLDSLEKAGYLQRVPGRPRALEVTPTAPAAPEARPASTVTTIELPVALAEGEGAAAVPLVGRIAAGAPITAEQYVEDVFELPTRLTGRGTLFMLEVHGDSMVEAGILDGDYVVVRSQPTAEDSEIVAAMIDGEATVKVLSRADGHVWLLPRNAGYSPIPGDEAVILGRVVTVLRSL